MKTAKKYCMWLFLCTSSIWCQQTPMRGKIFQTRPYDGNGFKTVYNEKRLYTLSSISSFGLQADCAEFCSLYETCFAFAIDRSGGACVFTGPVRDSRPDERILPGILINGGHTVWRSLDDFYRLVPHKYDAQQFPYIYTCKCKVHVKNTCTMLDTH